VDKEALVIYGSIDIPKLYAASHKAKKQIKNAPYALHQAVSLARFEQDPMAEVCNVWSNTPSENPIL